MRATTSAPFEENLYKITRRALYLTLVSGASLFITGCATPPEQHNVRTEVISPDQRDNLGGTGIESEDIRTAATRFASAIISLPQVAQKTGGAGIAIAPIVNSSAQLIDKDIFAARLRIELNKYSQGRVRFFAQGAGQDVRSEVLQAKDEEQLKQMGKDTSGSIISSFTEVRKPSSGLAAADFILTGELRGLSKATGGGDRSDYILMSFQLVDPVSNQIIWEDAYETKKVSSINAVYK
jgi:PBP1b-binding outer membrane lipoprotein LpoB